ncbi:rRNA maturation RNase YbeY [Parvibium lacunae]|uniref:Endoribonuclease YbeY n=1 Tax=Parvibium lacunae TaxID=1888893 RepID=A0A368L4K8_9BURK|nr:rRNA maturation RNase YbeY [Parvibium lacunae]RCS58413.1 rRNA maturation RNase YbeY [Parvibium lacunae]
MSSQRAKHHQTWSIAVQYGLSRKGLPAATRLRHWARCALENCAHSVELTLRIVDHEEGASLNQSFRQKNYATNVLTFEYGLDPITQSLTADIILCAPVIASEASEQGKPLAAHYAHMVVHGVLHALGYDHIKPKEAKVMEALEVELLARLGYANPYAR